MSQEEKPWKDVDKFFPYDRQDIWETVVQQIEILELKRDFEIEDDGQIGSLVYDVHKSLIFPTHYCVTQRVFTEMSAELQEKGKWTFEHALVHHNTFEIGTLEDAQRFDIQANFTYRKFKRWVQKSNDLQISGNLKHIHWRFA